jgi:hypothetical protein
MPVYKNIVFRILFAIVVISYSGFVFSANPNFNCISIENTIIAADTEDNMHCDNDFFDDDHIYCSTEFVISNMVVSDINDVDFTPILRLSRSIWHPPKL